MVGGVAKQRERKGNYYVESRMRLEAEVNQLSQHLQQLEEEKQRTAAKELVLANLVAQQDVMLEKLKQLKLDRHNARQQQICSSTAAAATDAGPTVQQPGFASDPLTGTYKSPFALRHDQLQLLVDGSCDENGSPQRVAAGVGIDRPSVTSPFKAAPAGLLANGFSAKQQQGYMFKLLAATTKEQWEEAVNMTALDWCQFYTSLVARLMHYSAIIMSQAEQQQRQQARWQAGAATAADAAEQVPPEVQQIMDNFFARVAVILATNTTMPYRLAAHVDLSTGIPVDNLPANHWRQVVDALRLTPLQSLQLKSSWVQFRRAKQQLKGHQAEVGRKIGVATDMKAARWGTEGAVIAEVHEQHLASLLDIDSQDNLVAILRLDSEDGTACSEPQQPPPAAAATAAATAAGKIHCSQPEEALPDPRRLTPEWAGAEVIAHNELSRILSASDVVLTMLSCFVINQLTPRQLACLLIKSYPVLPRVAAVLEVLDQRDAVQDEGKGCI